MKKLGSILLIFLASSCLDQSTLRASSRLQNFMFCLTIFVSGSAASVLAFLAGGSCPFLAMSLEQSWT